MGKLMMTRRAFAKAAAVSGAAIALGTGTTSALAETTEAAKTQSADSQGVKKVRSCCRGCGKV